MFLATALAIGFFLGNYKPEANANPKVIEAKSKINKLLDLIDKEYVDQVNTDSIVDITVNGILEKLDPHSIYIPKKDLAYTSESLDGNFVGIGINFYMYKDSLAVIKPVKNGPSEKAGIQAGDRILYAGKKQLFNKHLTSEDLFKILKGTEGSEIDLTVYRKSANKKFKVRIERGIIPIESVEVATKISKSIGYIKINRFAETTYTEFKKGLENLKKQGATEVIIDLRGNGGGYMEIAVAMADEFLKKGELIVITKNKNGKKEKTYATRKGIFETGKVAVILDENSASASEIFAGAIQDNDRGLIYGRRSFGKGLVQKEMQLDDGSAVRLTVARYYTPSGRSIQKPYEKDLTTYYNDFEKRYAQGELFKSDSIKVADSLKFKTKKGRLVYGGGGIIPDVFVPLEDLHSKEGVKLLLQSALFSYYVFERLDENRTFFSSLSKEELKKEIYTNDVYFLQFRKYCVDNGLLLNLSETKSLVVNYLHAEFCKQLFGDINYYQQVLPLDTAIQVILKKHI